jgi:excisionase family DNA binding protein
VTTDSSTPNSYSTAEVARRLGVSVPTVQRWVDLGHLKAWKTVGGHRRIEAQSAERMFSSLAGPGGTDVPPVPDAPGAALAEGVCVVVVDDNPDDRDVLSALLETAIPGARVAVTENGFQGLVAIGQTAPDIVVTDVAMPHMDGVEMLRHLSTALVRPRLIVAVSSRTPQEFAALGEIPPDVHFVPKPIDPQRFIGTLHGAMRALGMPVVGTG